MLLRNSSFFLVENVSFHLCQMFYHLKWFCLLYPCTPVPARMKHVQSSQRIISQKACELIIQILYILFLHNNRVWPGTMWQQSWCDMSKVRPEDIMRIKIRAKSIFTKFGFWAHNFLLNSPLAYPVQVQFDSHISETFCCSKYSFSQFWTVFPSFGREKLGKTGLSQFIPFWTEKTGFGREKPNPELFYYVLVKIQKIWYIYYQRVNLQDNGNRVNHWTHCETKQPKDRGRDRVTAGKWLSNILNWF